MNSVGPVMASSQAGSAMTLHCTENQQSGEARTRAVNTAVCPANHFAITAADGQVFMRPQVLKGWMDHQKA